MNKKILFLILLAIILVLPIITYAAAGVGDIGSALKKAAISVGFPLIIVGWIIAGILYLTSAGGPQMQTAKNALIACVIGTLLVAIAANSCTFIQGLFGIGTCQ